MSKRFSSSIKPLSLACAVLFLLAPAFASKKDDDYKKAKAAEDAGNSAEAARLYCALRDEDEKFKDVARKCEMWASEMKRIRKVEEKLLADGTQAFNQGRYDDAEQKLKNIKVADLAAQAREYLGRIAALRSEDTKLQQGVQAYNGNDFVKAKDLLGGVSGGRAGDARGYLDKIRRYEQAMAEGSRATEAKNYKDAATSYNEAAQIKADGPGDPRGKLSQVNALSSAPPAAPPSSPPGRPAGGTATAPAPSQPAAVVTSRTEAPAAPPASVQAAVKTVTPTLDTAKLMREAESAKNKGDIGAAKGKYLALLAAEPSNARVRAALNALPQAPAGSTQSAGVEADVMLARAISEFYTGQYEASEVHIRDYLDANGSKTGLAYFYLGAGKVTRYYLAGAGQDKKLLTDGRSAFQKARQIAGFQPPDQKYVSPKVLSLYEGSAQ